MNGILWLLAGLVWAGPVVADAKPPQPVTLIVMDPLSKELACACVKGHGQRDYRKLAARLERALGERVMIEFTDDLGDTLTVARPGPEVIVVGDTSIVTAAARSAKLQCHAVCELTDRDGSSTCSSSFIVRAGDPARTLKDVNGRKLLFGLAEGDSKRAAALAALRGAGVEPAPNPQTRAVYTDAALDMLDSTATPGPVAVIPSYGIQMLEGCGSVKPGEVRVIGRSEATPFIAVFVADALPAKKRTQIEKTLLGVKEDAKLLEALESKNGFQPVSAGTRPERHTSAVMDWPDWRGAKRDGHVPKLPSRLAAQANFTWKKPAMPGGLAGLSVSNGRLFVTERDFGDENDVYRCLDANTGETLWRIEFPAVGKLDYGQSPRATPVIRKDRAYLLGAFGGLRCVEVASGKTIWERNLPREFKAELPTWGMTATPLVMEDVVVVNPGGKESALVALDAATGRTRWAVAGEPAAYASFVVAQAGGRPQVVGYDRRSLGGWDARTGQRLWRVVPPMDGDFNVPTPIVVEGGVVVATENNGTRFYRFNETGGLTSQPAAAFADLAPDSATPVVTAGRVFGASGGGLHCLDLGKGLKPVWHREEDAFSNHATLIADDDRVLVIAHTGEILLVDARGETCSILSRLRVFEEDVEVYSHPALVDNHLYLRGGSKVACVDLSAN